MFAWITVRKFVTMNVIGFAWRNPIVIFLERGANFFDQVPPSFSNTHIHTLVTHNPVVVFIVSFYCRFMREKPQISSSHLPRIWIHLLCSISIHFSLTSSFPSTWTCVAHSSFKCFYSFKIVAQVKHRCHLNVNIINLLSKAHCYFLHLHFQRAVVK